MDAEENLDTCQKELESLDIETQATDSIYLEKAKTNFNLESNDGKFLRKPIVEKQVVHGARRKSIESEGPVSEGPVSEGPVAPVAEARSLNPSEGISPKILAKNIPVLFKDTMGISSIAEPIVNGAGQKGWLTPVSLSPIGRSTPDDQQLYSSCPLVSPTSVVHTNLRKPWSHGNEERAKILQDLRVMDVSSLQQTNIKPSEPFQGGLRTIQQGMMNRLDERFPTPKVRTRKESQNNLTRYKCGENVLRSTRLEETLPRSNSLPSKLKQLERPPEINAGNLLESSRSKSLINVSRIQKWDIRQKKISLAATMPSSSPRSLGVKLDQHEAHRNGMKLENTATLSSSARLIRSSAKLSCDSPQLFRDRSSSIPKNFQRNKNFPRVSNTIEKLPSDESMSTKIPMKYPRPPAISKKKVTYSNSRQEQYKVKGTIAASNEHLSTDSEGHTIPVGSSRQGHWTKSKTESPLKHHGMDGDDKTKSILKTSEQPNFNSNVLHVTHEELAKNKPGEVKKSMFEVPYFT